MIIRKTTSDDIKSVLEVYREGRDYMRQNGNFEQWNDGYPAEEIIVDDIENGSGYVACEGEEILGVFAFFFEDDPTYKEIRDGSWTDERKYSVLHRISTSHHRKGVAAFIVSEMSKIALKRGCFSMRVDTHRDNIPMQKFLEKNGFERCGIISLDGNWDNSPMLRIAYQKILV